MRHDLTIRMRLATIDDLALLQSWDDEPHVISCDPTDDWSWAEELARSVPWREQWIAELSGRPIGCLQIIDPAEEESHYWGDIEPNLRAIDIWIGEESDLSKGYGTQMMQWAISRCFANDTVKAIIIDPLLSNERAIRFYERQGFRPVGPRRFGQDDCLVMRLDRRDHAPG